MTSVEILGLHMCMNQLVEQRTEIFKEMLRCSGNSPSQAEWYRKEYYDLGEEIQRIRKVLIEEEK